MRIHNSVLQNGTFSSESESSMMLRATIENEILYRLIAG
jgi:hypothetical protein